MGGGSPPLRSLIFCFLRLWKKTTPFLFSFLLFFLSTTRRLVSETFWFNRFLLLLKMGKRDKETTTEEEKKERKERKERKEKKKEKKEKREKKEKKDKKRKRSESESGTAQGEKKRKKSESEAPKKEANKSSPASSSNGPYQQPNPPSKEFKKAFYQENANVSAMSAQTIAGFLESNNIKLNGNNCSYRHIEKLSETGMSENVMKICSGFEKPTPIQSQCWPILLSGRDLIAIAETGSGKTLAFSLPGLTHIVENANSKSKKGKKGPTMLVLSPTRELATQSAAVLSEACQSNGLKSLCVYGGVPKHEQRSAIRAGVDVIVATPGRLRDLVQEGALSLAAVTYLTLDEADRMLDEGFEKEVRDIISNCHRERQVAMFSATWPESVEKLAHQFLTDPVQVTVGELELSANKRITQIVEVVDPREKNGILLKLLSKYHKSRKNRVLIFVLYKKEADRVERFLYGKGWNCVSIHGDKNQRDRTAAVNSFIDGSVPLLVATDVAARGLDIPGVEVVLNYSFPLTIEDYVHRIGRTGRAGKTGVSHTLFTNFDKQRGGDLVEVLKSTNQQVPPELLKFGPSIKKKKEHAMYGAWTKDVDMTKKATKITFDDDSD